jgi:hypothetical protein
MDQQTIMLYVNRKNFVIFTHYRAGSRSLLEALRSQGISVFDEPFNHTHCLNDDDKFDNSFTKLIQTEEPTEVFNQIFQKCQGFKHIFLQLSQINNEIILEKYPVIFLTRKDLPLAALSFHVARISEIWHATKRNKNGSIRKDNRVGGLQLLYEQMGPVPLVNLEITKKNFELIKIYEDKIKNGIQVYYEDLYSDNWKAETQRIFDFLDCKIINWQPLEDIMGPSNKLNDENLYQKITNYEEIKDFLSQQPLVDSEQASEAQNS